MKTSIRAIPIYDDNYVWVIDDGQFAVVVDPGLAEPVQHFLKTHNLSLQAILITHHHWDHINGVEALQEKWACDVFGPNDSRIDCARTEVQEGAQVLIEQPNLCFNVIETPGHTLSHVCYHTEDVLFCGDTLFSLGCGRMFEGTPEQFVSSLHKIKRLNPDIKIYCTHEYTLSNIAFAESLEPDNQAIKEKQQWASEQRQMNQPTIPITLKEELKLNPFLRTDDLEFQKSLVKNHHAQINDEVSAFAFLRKTKDSF